LVTAYAVKRSNGEWSLMLINKDGKNGTNVKVSITGTNLAGKGVRFDYGKTNPPDGNSVTGKPMDGGGNSFSVAMPPYTATVILIPKA